MSRDLILVVDDLSGSYYQPFRHLGTYTPDSSILVKHPERVRLVVFTGGEDVSPSVYGEQVNRRTYANPARDFREGKVFKLAVEAKIPIAGICRGAQLICAHSGGKLIQHVNGHSGYHTVVTDEGETLTVSSTHHQMQLPPDNAKVVAWAEPRRSNCYEGAPGVNYEPKYEYEIVYYPDTNAVGMQYHPEFMPQQSRGFQYVAELMNRFFGMT